MIPGMASDLHGKISRDDFNLQAAAIAIRHFSPKLSIGFGAAYSTQFGEGYPLPVLALEWNNGSNMKLSAVVPTNIEFWYLASKKIGLGLSLKVEGNEYHGDPKIYGVEDPRMKYSTVMLSPTVKYYFTKSLQFNISGGYIGLHRFEFYDGDDKKETYDLKPSSFVRLEISYGA